MIRAVPAGRASAQLALGLLGALLLSVGLTGCPGSLDPALVGVTGGAGSGGGCNAAQAMAKLATYNCSNSSCHGGAAPASGFDMATPGWETHLVGGNPSANSTACMTSAVPYLQPNTQPATGLFLDKIKGTQACGMRMPYGSPTGVAQADVDCIQSWANMLVAAGGGGNTDAGGGQ